MNEEYKEILGKLTARQTAASEKRAALEIELRDLDTEIVNLNAAISRILSNMGVASDGQIAELGFTDAVRRVVSERMTATQIRERLEKAGFNLKGYSNPMASIYKILERLEKQGELEAEKEGWNVFYKPKRRGRYHVVPRRRSGLYQRLLEVPPVPTIDTIKKE